MEQRLNIVGLGVADVATATGFYQRLGWTVSSASNPAITFMQAGGVVVSLFDRKSLLDEAGIDDPVGNGSAGVTLACNVDSRERVDAVLAEAVAAGARLTAPAIDRSWGGYSGYFADPDGHVWEVAWNPFLEVGPDGSRRLPD